MNGAWTLSIGKTNKSQHRATKSIHTPFSLELLHMDLMGPTRSESVGGKKYTMVVVDDYSRFTWVMLLKDKSKACDQTKILFKRIQSEKGCAIQCIRNDHGIEFNSSSFEKLCEEASIKHKFSSTIAP